MTKLEQAEMQHPPRPTRHRLLGRGLMTWIQTFPSESTA